MLTVDDFIAKRAESFHVLTETVDGLIPRDFAGTGMANIIAAGAGEFIKEVGGGIGTSLSLTITLLNGGVISGTLNLMQEPADGEGLRALVYVIWGRANLTGHICDEKYC